MGMGNMLVLSQVTGYALTFIVAFFIFIPVAVNKAEFNGHCLLYATGKWITVNGTEGPTLDISGWGHIDTCNFPIVVSVLTLPVSLAYCAFLSIDLFKNTEPSWLSAFICLLVTMSGWLLSLIAACLLTVGYNQWCKLIEEEVLPCREAQFANINVPGDINVGHFANEYGLAQFSMWVSWVTWTVLSVLAAIQLFRYHQNESFLVSIRRERERLIQRSQAPQTI